jgi:hypothetical protein
VKMTDNQWIVYPTHVIQEIALKHGIDVGELLYMLATKTLDDNIMEELIERCNEENPSEQV